MSENNKQDMLKKLDRILESQDKIIEHQVKRETEAIRIRSLINSYVTAFVALGISTFFFVSEDIETRNNNLKSNISFIFGSLPKYKKPHAHKETVSTNTVYLHKDLIAVYRLAQKKTQFNIHIREGVRTLETQKRYVARGVSKTLNSRHLTGHAIDLEVLYGGKHTNQKDWYWCRKINKAMQESAKELGISIKWGGDWGWDGYHYQLSWKDYPKKSMQVHENIEPDTEYWFSPLIPVIQSKIDDAIDLMRDSNSYVLPEISNNATYMEVARYVREANNHSNLPSGYLTTLAYFEGDGFNRLAVSPTGAVGLWQYTETKAIENGLIHNGIDSRTDIRLSTKQVIADSEQVKERLKSIGINITDENQHILYFVHNIGFCGYKQITKLSETGSIDSTCDGVKVDRHKLYKIVYNNLSKRNRKKLRVVSDLRWFKRQLTKAGATLYLNEMEKLYYKKQKASERYL